MLALVFVESLVNNTTVLDLNIWFCRIALPGESVLHPFLIVTLVQTKISDYATRNVRRAALHRGSPHGHVRRETPGERQRQ